jgi:cytochrome o ubiquinol oxidase subunit 3
MELTAGTADIAAAELLEADADRAFGFWIYLMSDAVIFALLFATYAVMSRNYAGGPTGQTLFDLGHTFAETLLLLSSSIAYGLVSLAVARARRVQTQLWLGVAFLLGLGFVLMELAEFNAMIAQGAGPDRSGFLSAFFTLVGTHGTHVSFGLIWILVMMAQVSVKGLTAPVRSRLLRLGMFWHFLDIMWIGIFSIVYLMGVL